MHSKNQKRHISPCPPNGPLVPMKPPSVAPSPGPGPGDTLAFRVPKDFPHSRFSKAPLAVYPPKGARNKPCVSLPVVSLEKIPCLSRADGVGHIRLTSPSSSSPSSLKPSSLPPSASHRSGEKLVNGRGSASGPSAPRSTPPPSSQDSRPGPARSPLDKRPSSSPSPLDRRPSPAPSPQKSTVPSSSSSSSSSPLDRKHQNGTKTPSRPHKRLSGRVFDPDKHCGVQDPESKRSCTRSLTCKTHSLRQRRAVPGRQKLFDLLLAEHKGRAKEKEGTKEKEKERNGVQGRKESGSQSVTSQETTTPSMPHCPNGRPLSTLKLRLANAHIPRVPGGGAAVLTSSTSPSPAPSSSASNPAPSSSASNPAPSSSASNPAPSPPGWARLAGDGGQLSSDEGDAETPEDIDRHGCPFSSHHPRPLGCCGYSSRLMGRGHYVFDRRWDRMRLALQSMVERHLSSHMWRKVPLAAESLLSLCSSSSSSAPPLLPSPPPFPPSSPPFSLISYTAAFPTVSSVAGVFGVRDLHRPVSAPGKPRNGAPRPGRPPRESEETVVGTKRRKTISSSASSSSFASSSSSSSSSSPSVDGQKRNGSSYHPFLRGLGGTAAVPGRRKGLGRGSGGREDWLWRGDGSQSHGTQNSSDPTSNTTSSTTTVPYTLTRTPASTPVLPPATPPAAPLAYGGGVEGRKRRSPGSYGGKPSKLSRGGGLDGLFRRANSTGVLVSGSESPRQAKLHH